MDWETKVALSGLADLGLPISDANCRRWWKAVDIVANRLSMFYAETPKMYSVYVDSDSRKQRTYQVYVYPSELACDCGCEDKQRHEAMAASFGDTAGRHFCKHAIALLMRIKNGKPYPLEIRADDDYRLLQVGDDDDSDLQLFAEDKQIHHHGFKESRDSLDYHKGSIWESRFFYHARYLVKVAKSFDDLRDAYTVRELIPEQIQLSPNSYLMTQRALIYQAVLDRIVSLGLAKDKIQASRFAGEEIVECQVQGSNGRFRERWILDTRKLIKGIDDLLSPEDLHQLKAESQVLHPARREEEETFAT